MRCRRSRVRGSRGRRELNGRGLRMSQFALQVPEELEATG